MTILYKNNAASTLSGGITAAATIIPIQAGDDGKFPVLATVGADYFYATLEDSAHNIEIVKVFQHVAGSNQLNVNVVGNRGVDGTTALAWVVGDAIDMRINAGAIADFQVLISAAQALIDAHIADSADAHDASAISFAGSANLSAADVEAALDELDAEKAGLALNNPFTGNNSFTGRNAIGTVGTDPGWGSNYKVWQVADRTYLVRAIAGANSGEFYITTNLYNDNTNWRAIATGKGSIHAWYLAGAGVQPNRQYFADNGAGGDITAAAVATLTEIYELSVGNTHMFKRAGGSVIVADAPGSSTYSCDASRSNSYNVTVFASATFTMNAPTFPVGGFPYTWFLNVGATAVTTITWPANFKWTGGVNPTGFSANTENTISCIFNGTNFVCSALLGVAV